jgi:hypothetical protein
MKRSRLLPKGNVCTGALLVLMCACDEPTSVQIASTGGTAASTPPHGENVAGGSAAGTAGAPDRPAPPNISWEMVNASGWVGSTPECADGPGPECGVASIQGAFFAFGAGNCVAPAGNPCSEDGCCVAWTTTEDSEHSCGLGLELNRTAGDAPVKSPYRGPATIFRFVLEGDAPPGGLRIGMSERSLDTSSYSEPITLPADALATFVEVPTVGQYEMYLVGTGDAALQLSEPNTPYDLIIQAVGGADAHGTLCWTSLQAT